MEAVPMSADEEKWRAESDARTLCEAEAIKADEGRMKKASDAAKRMLEEEKAKADAMKKVADAGMEYKNSPNPGGSKDAK